MLGIVRVTRILYYWTARVVVKSKDVIFDERLEKEKDTTSAENCILFGDVGPDVRLADLPVSDMKNVEGVSHDNSVHDYSQLQDKNDNGPPISPFARNDGDYSLDQSVASSHGADENNDLDGIDTPVVQFILDDLHDRNVPSLQRAERETA